MGNPCFLERLAEGLDQRVGRAHRSKILAGSEILPSLTELERAEWFKTLARRIDEAIPDEAARYDLMACCSCECADVLVDGHRAFYRQTGDLDQLLEHMYKNPFYVRPRREGQTIYFRKVAHNPQAFSSATSDAERRYHYCHCDHMRAVSLPVSPTHCYCSAGWYRRIWEGILERPVRVELLRSVLQGDECCEFAVHL